MRGVEMEGQLHGERVTLTGRLVSLKRAEAAALIRAHGGRYVRTLSARTSLLVVGQDGWPLRKDGRLSRHLREARQLVARGVQLRILGEDEFLEWLDLQERRPAVCRRYTLLQLTRLLKVPHARLRAWLRAELIRPVETVHRIMYFDYAAVAQIKSLCELLDAGVSQNRLQRSLRQLQQWLPRSEDLLRQLDRIARDGRLVFRLTDGRLAEPHGQLLFDFESRDGPSALNLDCRAERSPEQMFERALHWEDAGRFDEAAATYRQWLEAFGPDAGVLFNLGNSLFGLGDVEGAAAAFREAVRLDPQFVEAWSNLGQVLVRQGDYAEAIRAIRRALNLDPYYADAHFNLADLLDRLGRSDLAADHWQTYLRFDATSEWADYARRRLSGQNATADR